MMSPLFHYKYFKFGINEFPLAASESRDEMGRDAAV